MEYTGSTQTTSLVRTGHAAREYLANHALRLADELGDMESQLRNQLRRVNEMQTEALKMYESSLFLKREERALYADLPTFEEMAAEEAANANANGN